LCNVIRRGPGAQKGVSGKSDKKGRGEGRGSGSKNKWETHKHKVTMKKDEGNGRSNRDENPPKEVGGEREGLVWTIREECWGGLDATQTRGPVDTG